MAYKWGVDTSEHQGSKVDYAKLKAAGADFVFLRIGYNQRIDKCFEKDYAAATAAGLKVGVYFYTMSKTADEASKDGTRVLGWLAGRKLSMPVVYDLEDSTQQGSSRMAVNSQMYNAFAGVVKQKYETMLYTGEYFFNAYFDKASITDKLWIAKYSSSEPNVGKAISIWQYTSSEVDADYYKGALDRNYMLSDEWETSGSSGCGCGCGAETKVPSQSHDNPYPVPTGTLRRTNPMTSGDGVKWLQTELKRYGLIENGGVDGWFGDKTLAAVRIYQQQNGLAVDGIVGPATVASLLNS